MPSDRFRTPPDNPASFKNRPPGTPRPVLVKRAVPKKPALAVETVLATHDEPVVQEILSTPALSTCNAAASDVVFAPAAITPRLKRKRTMADVNVPSTLTYFTDLDLTPVTVTLDPKARKGMTSLVFVGGAKRGSVRIAKSRFSTAAVKEPRAKMSPEEAKAARIAGRERVKSLSLEEQERRIDELAAKRKEKLRARAAKEQPQLTMA